MRRGTRTFVAESLVGAEESAEKAYDRNVKEVKKLLKRLETAMDKHAKQQKAKSDDWGYVGDMGHVASELTDIVGFLKG